MNISQEEADKLSAALTPVFNSDQEQVKLSIVLLHLTKYLSFCLSDPSTFLFMNWF